MTSRLASRIALACAGLACAMPLSAMAQSLPYGDVSGGGGASSGDGQTRSSGRRSASGRSEKRTEISPYIEVQQIVTAELQPGDDVLTWTGASIGVDGIVVRQRVQASFAARYEHRFGYGKSEDSDYVVGLARGSAKVAPGVQIDAGAYASRAAIERTGTATLAGLGDQRVKQIYSGSIGPAVKTQAGDVEITGGYQFGYSRVEEPDTVITDPAQRPTDFFEDSTTHTAAVRAGVSPGDVLPVGVGIGAGYNREDISNLDQRIEDAHVRGDVTIPLDTSVALVGGVGYEHVEIAARDAVRDANGDPVIAANGNYLTDKSQPRAIAYDVDGLIWDAGVIWRPSRRTALEAHVGRRYGSTSVYGSFGYKPNSRSTFNVSVYDSVAGFGGQLNRQLIALPTEFEVIQNPLTGNIGSCVSSLEGGNCLTGSLGSVRSAAFRARGVTASYNHDFGRFQTGLAGGYDRRKYIGARGTVLESINGLIEENYFASAHLYGQLDEKSLLITAIYANWFKTDSPIGEDSSVLSALASYRRNLTRNFSATAALGIDGVNRQDPLEDYWDASALLGLRYSF